MIYNNDDFLYKLNRPMMMAVDDEDDDLFNEEDLDDDPLEDEDKDLDDLTESEGATAESGEASSEEGGNERNSSGISRSAMGFGALAFLGVIPLVLMILYMLKGNGLSGTAMLFMFSFFIGMILSVWTFIYYRSGNASFTRFDTRSYFKWPEIALVSVILMGISFMNISNLYSGGAIRLSSESTILKAVQPKPMFAPKPPKNDIGVEENEVLYETPEFSPVKEKAPKVQPAPKQKVNKAAQQRVFRRVAPAPVKSASPSVNNQDDSMLNAHEDEEGTSTITGKSMDQLIEESVNIAETSANNFSNLAPVSVLETEEKSAAIPMTVETSPMVSSLFLGGILCAALGYAFPLAIAGAIIGLFRRFNHPFAAKTKEIINEETGEITLETESQTSINKILDHVFRFFIGFNIGGTVGFLLGCIITIPLYLIFWNNAQTDPLISNILMTLGVVKNPDLAYGTGLIVAGIMVPVLMMVGKASPAGMSISEEAVRQVYSIPVTINKVSQDMSSIPEPAIISFDLDEDSDSGREGTSADEFSDDSDESLTQDLLSEFGVDLENVFGMKVNMPVKSNGENGNGHKVSNYEKQKINSILENSLGELGNVTVQVSAELGQASIMLTDWLNLSEGMLIELDKPVSEEIDILINDVCKGKGKLTVVDNHLSVKVSKSNFSQSAN